MRKLIIAAVVVGSFAAPAMASHTVTPVGEAVGEHDNRGQCQSALVRLRNERRQDPSLRSHFNENDTNAEFNAAFRNWECTQGSDGKWRATRV